MPAANLNPSIPRLGCDKALDCCKISGSLQDLHQLSSSRDMVHRVLTILTNRRTTAELVLDLAAVRMLGPSHRWPTMLGCVSNWLLAAFNLAMTLCLLEACITRVMIALSITILIGSRNLIGSDSNEQAKLWIGRGNAMPTSDVGDLNRHPGR